MKKIISTTITICVACVLIVFVAINVCIPVYARTIPFFGSAFAFVQDKLDFAGLYSNYAFEVGDTAVDNGITVMLSEIYCDGTSLYAGFVVESENLFLKYLLMIIGMGNYTMKVLPIYQVNLNERN